MKEIFGIMLLGAGMLGVAMILFKDLRASMTSFFKSTKTASDAIGRTIESVSTSNPVEDAKAGRVVFMYPRASMDIDAIENRFYGRTETESDYKVIKNFYTWGLANQNMNEDDAAFREMKSQGFALGSHGFTETDWNRIKILYPKMQERQQSTQAGVAGAASVNATSIGKWSWATWSFQK